MPATPLPESAVEFLKGPHPAVVAVLRDDGTPVSVATWYLWDEGRILLNMQEDRTRLAYLRNDPRLSLTVLDSDSWYTHLSLQGRIVEFADDPDLADIDRLAVHYRGEPDPVRDRGRVSAWMEIERWHGWGAQKAK